MFRLDNTRRSELLLFAAILSSGICKTVFGVALFFGTSWAVLLVVAAFAVFAAFLAGLVLRRNPQESRLDGVLNFAASFSSLVSGSIFLCLVLTTWRGALVFCVLLIACSPQVQCRLTSGWLKSSGES